MSRSPIESREVIIHLQAQLASLLGLRDVLAEQDDAVEASDPQRVLDAVAELRVQLAGRVQIETEREQLLARAQHVQIVVGRAKDHHHHVVG